MNERQFKNITEIKISLIIAFEVVAVILSVFLIPMVLIIGLINPVRRLFGKPQDNKPFLKKLMDMYDIYGLFLSEYCLRKAKFLLYNSDYTEVINILNKTNHSRYELELLRGFGYELNKNEDIESDFVFITGFYLYPIVEKDSMDNFVVINFVFKSKAEDRKIVC